MSFRVETPGMPSGTPAAQVGALYRYLTRMTEQLNFALGFLDLPAAVTAGTAAEPESRTATIGENSTNAMTPSARAVYNYAVPQTRKVNGHALSVDLALTPADLGAVPVGRKVNGYALEADITLSASDVGAATEADISDAIDASEARVAEYVTNTGSDQNGWQWREWSSGRIEMWANGYAVSLGPANAWTPDLVYQTGTVTYPFALDGNEAESVQITQTQPSGQTEINGLLLICVKSATGCQVRFAGKTSASQVYLDLYVMGKKATAGG